MYCNIGLWWRRDYKQKRNKSLIFNLFARCDHLCLVLPFLNINQVCSSSTLARWNLQKSDFRVIPTAKRSSFILQIHNLFVHERKTEDLPLDSYISWSLPSPSEQQTFELFGSCRGLSWSLPAISRAGASTACRGQEEDFYQFLLIYFILMIITEPSSLIISRSPSGSTWGQELAQADSCSAPSTASWCPWPAGQYMLD